MRCRPSNIETRRAFILHYLSGAHGEAVEALIEGEGGKSKSLLATF